MPSEEYTPTTEVVADCFTDGAAGEFIQDDFYAWLATHDVLVRRDEREKCAQIADGRIHPNTSPCPVCDAVAAIRAQSEEANR